MSADAQNPSELPSGLLEALQGRTKKSKPPFRPLSGFENGLKDLTAEGDQPSNKYQLLCPRDECRSVILREGVATLCEGFNIQLEPGSIPKHSLLPAISETTAWWLIQPTPMEFENIGFSRAVDALPLSPDGQKLKLLICADCDLGPLGWCEEGGKKFYLACSRVSYRYES